MQFHEVSMQLMEDDTLKAYRVDYNGQAWKDRTGERTFIQQVDGELMITFNGGKDFRAWHPYPHDVIPSADWRVESTDEDAPDTLVFFEVLIGNHKSSEGFSHDFVPAANLDKYIASIHKDYSVYLTGRRIEGIKVERERK